MLQNKLDSSWSQKAVYGYLGPLFLLAIYLIGLDRSFLFDVDEGAFTEATREMLVSRDWWHTTLNGTDRFDKPIGVYWLQAISASLFGLNEFAFRLPSALSAWAATMALCFFVYEKWGNKAALIAGLISATSLGPWAMARTATADALLGMFFVLSFLDLWRALVTQRLFYSRRLAVWVGLGLLVKGPVAVVVPLGTLIVYFFFVHSVRTHIKKMMLDTWSWLILLGISLPWYIYAYARHGQSFIDGFLLKHNVERFTGSLEGHSGAWFYFLLAMPILWMPWSVFIFKAFANFKSQWNQSLLKFSWIWFCFVLVFFSLANTKLPHYLLYAGPAVCVLLTFTSLQASRSIWILNWILALLGLVLLLLLPGVLQDQSHLIGNTVYQQLLSESETDSMWKWLFALPSVFCVLFVLNIYFQKIKVFYFDDSNQIISASVAVLQSVVLALIVLPWWAQTLQAPVHDLAVKLKDRPETIVQWRVHFPSFATYRNMGAPKREPQTGEMALVKNQEPYWPSDWEIVATSGPFSVVKPATLMKVSP